jgi:hypothetical protein
MTSMVASQVFLFSIKRSGAKDAYPQISIQIKKLIIIPGAFINAAAAFRLRFWGEMIRRRLKPAATEKWQLGIRH